MISVIACTNRAEFVPNIIKNFERQTLKEKELILILNAQDIIEEKAALIFPAELSLGECLNRGAALAQYPIVAKMDDDDYYGPDYLTEVLDSFTKSDADVVGKSSFYIFFRKNQEVRLYNPGFEQVKIPSGGPYKTRYFLSGATLAFKKEILEEISFPHVNQGEDSGFQQLCFANGLNMYSTSKDHYAYVRYSEPSHHHSDAGETVLKRRSRFIAKVSEVADFLKNNRQ